MEAQSGENSFPGHIRGVSAMPTELDIIALAY
jgi:hypothetical protein